MERGKKRAKDGTLDEAEQPLTKPEPRTPRPPGPRPEPFPWQLLAVALLMLAALVRFGPSLLAPVPLPDEMGYVRGIRRVLAGGSPYPGGSYLYPPLVAHAGAWAWAHISPGAVLGVFRAANLLGLAAVVWCAAAGLAWRWGWRVAAGAAYLAVAPAVAMGLRFGNLSLAVAGMIVLGLRIWPRRPWSAGVLLGLSVAVKPVAPAAVAVLAAHRPRRGGWRHLEAVVAAAVVAAVLIFSFPTWKELLLPLERPSLVASSLSVHRLAHLAGLGQGSLVWVSAAVAATAVGLVRLAPLAPRALFGVAVAAGLAATPSVWPHTLLVALPLEVLALQTAASRWAAAEPPRRRRRLWELVFLALAVAAIQLSEGATSLDDRAAVFQIFALLPPLVAPGVLAWYVVREDQASRRSRAKAKSVPSP